MYSQLSKSDIFNFLDNYLYIRILYSIYIHILLSKLDYQNYTAQESILYKKMYFKHLKIMSDCLIVSYLKSQDHFILRFEKEKIELRGYCWCRKKVSN